jgi:DNA-binding Xre family transcriptional regulator
MTIQTKIRVLLAMRDNMSEAELSRRLGILPQNLCRKMRKGTFSDDDISKIADILDCDAIIPPRPLPTFTLRDTGEQI